MYQTIRFSSWIFWNLLTNLLQLKSLIEFPEISVLFKFVMLKMFVTECKVYMYLSLQYYVSPEVQLVDRNIVNNLSTPLYSDRCAHVRNILTKCTRYFVPTRYAPFKQSCIDWLSIGIQLIFSIKLATNCTEIIVLNNCYRSLTNVSLKFTRIKLKRIDVIWNFVRLN